MRPRTIPILAAVALSLAVPSNADARLRFGPAALLGGRGRDGVLVGRGGGEGGGGSGGCWAVTATRRGTIGAAQRMHRRAIAALALPASNGERRLARLDLRRARLRLG